MRSHGDRAGCGPEGVATTGRYAVPLQCLPSLGPTPLLRWERGLKNERDQTLLPSRAFQLAVRPFTAETDVSDLHAASSRLLWPAPPGWGRDRVLVLLLTQTAEQRGRTFPTLSLETPLKKGKN